MAALVLEDIANRAIRRERVFRVRADVLAQDDAWLISRYQMQSGHTSSGSGFVCSWVPGYRNVPTRNWRPVGYIPVGYISVIFKQKFARCFSRYYPSMSEMYYISIQCPGTAKCEIGFPA